ncbi:MAG: Bax inhibitor-1 family protein [Bacilli bacterium]|jgi:FtsH-binding integral membrane protein|nr:Bax inhibitor-1 family protein [Bacilli bacterium]
MDVSAVAGQRQGQSKFLAVVCGYLCIGLAITAGVAFLFSYVFYNVYYDPSIGAVGENALVPLLSSCGVALLVMLIDSIVLNVTLAKNKRGAWIPYILYCVAMGVWPGALLLLGVQPEMMGEAFAITSVAFVGMFLIGYFSKRDLSLMGMIGYGLLFGYLMVALLFGFWFWLSPGTFYVFDLVASFVVITFSMLLVGFEANRMNKALEYGTATNNTALFYAYQFYCDFINIFLRVLYILMLTRRNS